MHSSIRAIRRLALFFVWAVAIATPQWILLKFNIRRWNALPKRFHRVTCRILGIKVKVRGRIHRDKPTLYVCNHVSYLDIPVLGSVLEGSFVAKNEVDTWPLFGWLSRLQKTVFINRADRSTTSSQANTLTGRLEGGDNLILFPEGTSSDGLRLLPFKTALFAVATAKHGDKPVTVQPVTLAVTHLDNMPIGRWLRPVYAWYGDMDLGAHMWQFAGLGKVTVQLIFHPPMTVAEAGSRKALARLSEDRIAAGLAAANAGRPLPKFDTPAPAGPAGTPPAGEDQPRKAA
jgi:1-acyl-sn-glycerol-3-phosphate acyltransferase